MPSLIPYGRITLGNVRDVYGSVDYQSDTLSWRLPQSLGASGVQSRALIADPTGDYAIQEPRYAPIDADETLWLPAAGTTAQYTHGQDVQTGKKGLKQINGTADVTYDTTFVGGTRYSDVGFFLRLFRGGPVSGNTNADGSVAPPVDETNWKFYVHFSGDPYNPGADMGAPRQGPIVEGEIGYSGPTLRLAIEAGSPIRLEVTMDGGGTWTTADTAASLGESEAYLHKSRVLDIDVCPLTDPSWYAALPYSAQYSGPPPNLVAVTLNGGGASGATLVWRAEQATLAPGALRLAGQGGQWEALCWLRRYAPSASLVLPTQARPRAFQTEPAGGITGYAPFSEWGDITGILTDTNKAYATVDIGNSGAGMDSTNGFSYQTVALSAVHLTFPALQTPPNPNADTVTLDCYEWEDRHTFRQADFLGRTSATVWVEDMDGALAPGAGLPVAVQAATLFRGLQDEYSDYDDGAAGITGLAACGDDDLEWVLQDGIRYVRIPIGDRFRENVACGYLLPFDGQCHYYAMREMAHRMGVTDDWLSFPLCDRDSACPHYHLPQGTAQEPAFRFPPNQTVMKAMLQVRAASGEVDFQTGAICPMYLYFNSAGFLQYFPAPVGLVQTWLDPTLTPQSQSVTLEKTFSRVPELSGPYPVLNEFLRSGPLASRASLGNIRTDIVLQGIRPSDGALLDGCFTNPALSDGPTTNGYVGLPIAYIETSRRFSSVQAVEVALQAAAVQMSFPSVTTRFVGHFQSQLFGLTPIGVQDPGTQGTTDTVPYYTTDVTNHARSDGSIEWCQVVARLLGQAGD